MYELRINYKDGSIDDILVSGVGLIKFRSEIKTQCPGYFTEIEAYNAGSTLGIRISDVVSYVYEEAKH